ncbi:MAG: AtpZ/AtpI family protein [Mailhella sp.]|nr:AtpZ/AtpI family protein [Mailhella sp.]
MAEKTTEKAPGAFSLLGTASTMGLHMVSGPIVGGGLGWLVDHALDSWPVASAIGLLLGLAAGFRNVWADARYLERSNAALDEEKKKAEEAAQKEGFSSEKDRKKPFEKVAAAPMMEDVTDFHKVGAKGSEVAPSLWDVARKDDERNAEDDFTASVFAGTAAPEERGLEELDETLEAIRKALKGDGVKTEAGQTAEKG